jgi:ABC-type sugar transport system permease subunit
MAETTLRAQPSGWYQVRRHWSRYRAGYLFILPSVVLYAMFMIYPFFQSIYLSFTDWNGVGEIGDFVGLQNYRDMLRDDLLWKSLWHNMIWVVIGTIGPMVIGLLLALLLWRRPKGFTLFRTVYFLPQVLSPVVIAIAWGWIYNPVFGLLNEALNRVGLESLSRGWLGNSDTALYAVLVAAIWAETGFVFVVFLAGLQTVSRDLLEAATLDGANAWQRLKDVTIPQLSNVITVITALLLIGGFSVFDIIFVMTQGGPNHATEVIATYTYTEAFTQNRAGYSATLSLVLTVISLVVSVVFVRYRERGAD